MDAALRALDDVDAALPGMRARARALADATMWECGTMRRYRRRLDDWDGDMTQLAARIAGDRDQLQYARAGRAAALSGAGGG